MKKLTVLLLIVFVEYSFFCYGGFWDLFRLGTFEIKGTSAYPKHPKKLSDKDLQRAVSKGGALYKVRGKLKTLNFYRHDPKTNQDKYCEKLTSLPDLSSFTTLDYLDASFITNLISVSRLPESLTFLVFSGCRNLKQVRQLPCRLEHLFLMGCTSLDMVPLLPMSLKNLSLEGCIEIKKLPDLRGFKNLEELDISRTGLAEEIDEKVVKAASGVVKGKDVDLQSRTTEQKHKAVQILLEELDKKGRLISSLESALVLLKDRLFELAECLSKK